MVAPEIKLVYKRKHTGVKISESSTAAQVLKAYWNMDEIDLFESFVAVYLSNTNEVLRLHKISEGTINATLVAVRKILQGAILSNASSIILSHNHPSGSLKPSSQDIALTTKIKEASKYMDVKVLDHLILTSEAFMSFADEGLL
jgi:DNA repair protein RadC